MELANVTYQEVEPNIISLETEVAAYEVGQAVSQVFHDFSRKVSIPGFRKGKVPREILRQRLGRDTIQQETINRLLQPAYESALERTGLQPIDQVSVEVTDFGESAPLKFKTKLITRPDVQLGDYEQFDVEKPHFEVTDDEVQEWLEELRRRHAHYTETALRGIQNGDAVDGVLQIHVVGEQNPRDSHELRPFIVGENNLAPSLDAHVLGLKAGETAEFDYTYPEDYPHAELASKRARVKFQVNRFHERLMPDLDDSLAQEVGEYATLADLRTEIRGLLGRQALAQALKELEENLVGQVVERSVVSLPELLLERRVERRIKTFESELREQGASLEAYLQNAETSREQLKERFRERVETELRRAFVLEAIAGKENLVATDQEIAEHIAGMAKVLKQGPTELRRSLESSGGLKLVASDVIERKASRLVLERSGIALESEADTCDPPKPEEEGPSQVQPQETIESE